MSAGQPKFAAVTNAPQPTNTVLADKKLEVTYQIVKEQSEASHCQQLLLPWQALIKNLTRQSFQLRTVAD